MSELKVKVEKISIDTYVEAEREDLPAFALNRVHQRSSGNPYPNKIVLEAQREVKKSCEYTLIKLSNAYVEIGILPELGGKIWYAVDKSNGYEFFYKNNVVKPALIGVLGSWTSGGLEFNWPFHHRASTFMPVDYFVEETENEITVWLSEHDPIDRMKGMVGVSLKTDESIFHTKMKVDNLTPIRHSFLWWENAAVPVNKNYRIFFPQDVNYVNFHYKRSVTTYPIANNTYGNYNGIVYDTDTDISRHENTAAATSYFSAKSKYDFFGGYDEGKKAGVVHVADCHVSTGKKLFTWGYNQLSQTWERALTDTDGQYAELMAGSYSDNQPDFSWLEPFESKEFTQSWFPISGSGIPIFANEHGAIYWDDTGLKIQPCKNLTVTVKAYDGETEILSKKLSLTTNELTQISNVKKIDGGRVVLLNEVEKIVDFTVENSKFRQIPDLKKEMVNKAEVISADELYIQGVHCEQYRAPEYSAEEYYLEAVKRDPSHYKSLIALARLKIVDAKYAQALEYISRAEKSLFKFNFNPETGVIYYLKGLIYLETENFSLAYENLYKASWNYDQISPAMTLLGLLDIRNNEYTKALKHFERAIKVNANNVVANSFKILVTNQLYGKTAANEYFEQVIGSDKLNHYAHFINGCVNGDYDLALSNINTDINGIIMDFAYYALACGRNDVCLGLITAAENKRSLTAMPKLLKAYLINGKVEGGKYEEGIAFPFRNYELKVLNYAVKNANDDKVKGYINYLLGCIYYHKKQIELSAQSYKNAIALNAKDYKSIRSLAVIEFTQNGNKTLALELLKKAADICKNNKQLSYETASVMFMNNVPATEIISFLELNGYDRDDVILLYAKALSVNGEYEKSLKVLLERNFVACEGGEHAIVEQYMYALYNIGYKHYQKGEYEKAIECFERGVVFPDSLGAGVWNEAKLVPMWFAKCACLIKLGEKEKAQEILRYISNMRLEFFSNMYLNTLFYYKAKAMQLLGNELDGNALVNEKIKEYSKAINAIDAGYFNTTPFFESFITDAKTARKAYYSRLLYCCYLYQGNNEKLCEYLTGFNVNYCTDLLPLDLDV